MKASGQAAHVREIFTLSSNGRLKTSCPPPPALQAPSKWVRRFVPSVVGFFRGCPRAPKSNLTSSKAYFSLKAFHSGHVLTILLPFILLRVSRMLFHEDDLPPPPARVNSQSCHIHSTASLRANSFFEHEGAWGQVVDASYGSPSGKEVLPKPHPHALARRAPPKSWQCRHPANPPGGCAPSTHKTDRAWESNFLRHHPWSLPEKTWFTKERQALNFFLCILFHGRFPPSHLPNGITLTNNSSGTSGQSFRSWVIQLQT